MTFEADPGNKRDKMKQLASLHVTGSTYKDAAEAMGISASYAYYLKKQPEYKQELEEAKKSHGLSLDSAMEYLAKLKNAEPKAPDGPEVAKMLFRLNGIELDKPAQSSNPQQSITINIGDAIDSAIADGTIPADIAKKINPEKSGTPSED